MLKGWVRLISVFLFFLMLVSGCATVKIASQKTNPPSSSQQNEITENTNPAYDLLRSAEEYYEDGVTHIKKRQWDSARLDFDEALRLIAEVDASDDEVLSDRTDLLLREIAYDYRFALAHIDSLEADAAPIVLSVALENRAMSDDTRQRLNELAGELPKALSGEFDLPVVWNDRVKSKIIFLQTEVREPFAEWLKRSGRYIEMIKTTFRENGLPEDLSYLPLIESGFSPGAYSLASAVGIWQFIKPTGRQYELEINWWIDERRNPEKSTVAAANYLKTLFNKFGNWELSLAAYNCGDGRIKRTIEKQGTDNYWNLDLVNETEDYVPIYMAALIIAKNPIAYGFDTVAYQPYFCDTVFVDEPTNLELVAQCTDTTLSFIRELNPEILRYCTPPDITNYILRVPDGKGEIFPERYAKIPATEKKVWAHHKVKKGETLSEIAIHYNTTVSGLMEANNLKSAHKLSIGQELAVPISPKEAQALGAKVVVADEAPATKKFHTVKEGDNLSEIAEKYSVSLDDLLMANKLGRGCVITPGTKLLIPVGKTKTSYTVCSGDTPRKIAARFGVSAGDILQWNNLSEETVIYPGQKLVILAPPKGAGSAKNVVHSVEKGESLWSIARKYDIRVADLVERNNLPGANIKLSIGQKLYIYANPEEQKAKAEPAKTKSFYTVRKGDSLGAIAAKYGVTFEQIQEWNDKTDTQLQVGDKLVIFTKSKPIQKKTVASASVRTIKHKVSKGETLSGIAQKYGVSVSKIKEDNNKTGNALAIGEELTVRTSKPAKERVKIHNVKAGETLSSIAMLYGVLVGDLKDWNGKTDDVLLVGEVLDIKGGKEISLSTGNMTLFKHTVSSGQTLGNIARRYSVSIEEIKKWNDKKDDVLRIGEILIIYGEQTGGGFDKVSPTLAHKVEKGETLSEIARKYGTTTDAILNDNANLDPDRLRVGEVVMIKVENN